MVKTIKEIKEEIKELKGTNRLYKRIINDILNDAKKFRSLSGRCCFLTNML